VGYSWKRIYGVTMLGEQKSAAKLHKQALEDRQIQEKEIADSAWFFWWGGGRETQNASRLPEKVSSGTRP